MPSQQKSRIKVTDGHGLYLLIKPNGGKYWRLDYAIDSKRKTLAIGVYPRISLAEARESAENARRMIAIGQDHPSTAKQQTKQERQAALLNTLEAITHRWHSDNLHRWKLELSNQAQRFSKQYLTSTFPPQTFSGAKVDFVGNRLNLRCAVLAQVLTLGKILTQQTVGVFIATLLPRLARLRKVKRHLQFVTKLRMRGKPLTPVRRNGAQWYITQYAEHSRFERLCIFLGQPKPSENTGFCVQPGLTIPPLLACRLRYPLPNEQSAKRERVMKLQTGFLKRLCKHGSKSKEGKYEKAGTVKGCLSALVGQSRLISGYGGKTDFYKKVAALITSGEILATLSEHIKEPQIPTERQMATKL